MPPKIYQLSPSSLASPHFPFPMPPEAQTDERSSHGTASPYSMPNDNPEHRRLEAQSKALGKLLKGKLIHTPLTSPKAILDIGCGTGVITTQLAKLYPDAKVHGVDLSPVPAVHEKPENVEYIIGDIAQLAKDSNMLKPGSLDYIFQRTLVLGITDWPSHMKLCSFILAPGGWLELHELEMRFYDSAGSVISDDWQWLKALRSASLVRSIDLWCPMHFEALLSAAGFADVKTRQYAWNTGSEPWPEKPESEAIRRYSQAALIDNFPLLIRKNLSVSGTHTPEQIEELVEENQRVLKALPAGSHLRFWVVWARKP